MSQRLRSNKNKSRRLYILATLGVTVLLVIVAMADLGRGELSAEPVTIPEPSIRPPATKARK
jgi:hypothetical protein